MRSRGALLVVLTVLLGCRRSAPDRGPDESGDETVRPRVVDLGAFPLPVREALAERAVAVDLWIGADVVDPASPVPPSVRARVQCYQRVLEGWASAESPLSFVVHPIASEAEAEAADVPPNFTYETPEGSGTTHLALIVRGRAADAFVSPVVRPVDFEARLVRAIRRVSGLRTRVGLVRGSAALRVDPPSDVQVVTVERAVSVPEGLAAVYVVAPEPPFDSEEVAWLDGYVRSGGNVVVLDRGVEIEVDDAAIEAFDPRTTGLEAWLAGLGITIEPTVAADSEAASVPMPAAGGVTVVVPYPPVPFPTQAPWIADVGDAGIALFFPSPVRASAESGAELVFTTSPAGWTFGAVPFDLRIRDPRAWPTPSTTEAVPLGVTVRVGDGRVVVVGTPSLFDAAYLPTGPDALDGALELAFAASRPGEASSFGECP